MLFRGHFGWDQAKIDNLLRPVLSSYADRSTQLRIDQFLTHKQRFAKIRSKRLQQAVTAIVSSAGSEVNPELFYADVEHMPGLNQEQPDVPAAEPGSQGEAAGEPAAADAHAQGEDDKDAAVVPTVVAAVAPAVVPGSPKAHHIDTGSSQAQVAGPQKRKAGRGGRGRDRSNRARRREGSA